MSRAATRTSLTGLLVLVHVLAFVGVVSSVPAQAAHDVHPRDAQVPESGFGSREDPMTVHQGSGGLAHPLFRFFDPCAYFGPDSIYTLTPVLARLDDNVVFPTLTARGSVRKSWLQCTRLTIDPFGAVNFHATCNQRGHIVLDSYGYHHAAGPVIVPVAHLFSRDNSKWVRDMSLANIGWVRADVSLWWLCGSG